MAMLFPKSLTVGEKKKRSVKWVKLLMPILFGYKCSKKPPGCVKTSVERNVLVMKRSKTNNAGKICPRNFIIHAE
jgi:hypothetical protein